MKFTTKSTLKGSISTCSKLYFDQNIFRPRREIEKYLDSRSKRDTTQQFPYTTDSHSLSIRNHEIQNVTENGTNIWESFSFPIFGNKTKEFFISKLHHFTYYEINVQACRKKEGKEDTDSPCSSTSMQTARTLKKRMSVPFCVEANSYMFVFS